MHSFMRKTQLRADSSVLSLCYHQGMSEPARKQPHELRTKRRMVVGRVRIERDPRLRVTQDRAIDAAVTQGLAGRPEPTEEEIAAVVREWTD